MTRFRFDFSILSALLDHQRPETHTFHFTVGKLTPTLQDTSAFLVRAACGHLNRHLAS
jgi:hypothetical protein